MHLLTKLLILNKLTIFFATKLACETDCSDVYADIKEHTKNYLLLDVRSREAFDKSHAITAISMPSSEINSESLAKYDKDTLFVVYCWGPGCNGRDQSRIKNIRVRFCP